MVRTLDLAKRTAILAAAKCTFIQDGYATAKMSDIASAAGVAPGTLYLYFENKEALASAIGEDFFLQLTEQFGSMIRKIKNPDDIITLINWALRIAREDKVVLAMWKERHTDPKSKHEGRQRLITKLSDSLYELKSKQIIRQYADTKTLAELILSLMRRIIMSQAIFKDEDTANLKASAITIIQHVLFDDVTLAANQLVKNQR